MNCMPHISALMVGQQRASFRVDLYPYNLVYRCGRLSKKTPCLGHSVVTVRTKHVYGLYD